ncbi:MAG: hypothetical protein ACD_20C00374G0001 [uncultured bacterium]|nr:MAG: hypothetical protein ACD_20C00374G0001 [uncultured bacterium]
MAIGTYSPSAFPYIPQSTVNPWDNNLQHLPLNNFLNPFPVVNTFVNDTNGFLTSFFNSPMLDPGFNPYNGYAQQTGYTQPQYNQPVANIQTQGTGIIPAPIQPQGDTFTRTTITQQAPVTPQTGQATVANVTQTTNNTNTAATAENNIFAGLPPGLAKRGDSGLPPGLAKRGESNLPPGLAKN